MVPELWKLSHLSLGISLQVRESSWPQGIIGGLERGRFPSIAGSPELIPSSSTLPTPTLLWLQGNCSWGIIEDLWFLASAGCSVLLGNIYLLFFPFLPWFTHNSLRPCILASSPASRGRGGVCFLSQANRSSELTFSLPWACFLLFFLPLWSKVLTLQ